MNLPWKTDGLFWAGLILASAVIGIGVNMMRPHPLPYPYKDKVQRLESVVAQLAVNGGTGSDQPKGVMVQAHAGVLTLEQFLALRNDAAALVFDARPALFFKLGHVPGALSLPRDDFEAAYARLATRLPKERAVAVYCASETCEDAELVRAALVKLGHGRVAVFHGGWAEWQAAGLPEETQP